MPANTTPIFPLTPNIGRARIAAANTARDGSGVLVDLITGGTNGTRVNWIKFTSAQATAAASSTMVVRVFITDNAGANPRLLNEAVMTTLTPSTTVIGASVLFDYNNGVTVNNQTNTINGIYGGVFLASGMKLQVSQSLYAGAQDQNDVIAEGADF